MKAFDGSPHNVGAASPVLVSDVGHPDARIDATLAFRRG